jgi:hypothetical protein
MINLNFMIEFLIIRIIVDVFDFLSKDLLHLSAQVEVRVDEILVI